MDPAERFVDNGRRPGATGPVDAAAEPPAYLVAEGDDIDAIAARFAVPTVALIGADDRPVRMPMDAGQRDLVTGERLSVVLSLRSLAWMEGASIEDLEGGETLEGAGAEGFELPDPHPAFLRAFPGEHYRDEADEFAPFGTDEGFDARWSILRRASPLPATMSLAELVTWELGEDVEDALTGADEAVALELDPLLIGVAFTLLWSTGRIDAAGRKTLLDAIERQITRYGDDPRLTSMRADVSRLP